MKLSKLAAAGARKLGLFTLLRPAERRAEGAHAPSSIDAAAIHSAEFVHDVVTRLEKGLPVSEADRLRGAEEAYWLGSVLLPVDGDALLEELEESRHD